MLTSGERERAWSRNRNECLVTFMIRRIALSLCVLLASATVADAAVELKDSEEQRGNDSLAPAPMWSASESPSLSGPGVGAIGTTVDEGGGCSVDGSDSGVGFWLGLAVLLWAAVRRWGMPWR